MTEQLPDTPRRFVAGAKCPQCQVLDKIVMYRKVGIQYQSCVSCGHTESMVFESNFRELETRVNRTAEEKQQDVAVVRLIDSAYPSE
jgi:uncharacterized metal-binding protein (TIGR02443 family)